MRLATRSLCLFALGGALIALSACSPQYNWRQAHGDDLHFTVLLPAKPASFSRQIDLNGMSVMMTMTAAEIDDVTFAVGTAELADAGQTANTLESMRTALLNNIGGTLRQMTIPGQTADHQRVIDVTATGTARGQPLLLMARLVAKGKRVYQVLIVGSETAITPENAETFFLSFKPA